ncbi:hypothetical protein FOA52_001167 [Chlamydomonas sp. UWO 241]|nr:hypothetical protein FOA52_001167 [Chlamydomonas sp. UWO 241]
MMRSSPRKDAVSPRASQPPQTHQQPGSLFPVFNKCLNLSDDGVSRPTMPAIAAACAAPFQQTQHEKGPMQLYQPLLAKLAAARNCMLSPTINKPAAGTPGNVTQMMSLARCLPPNMERGNWCLGDYEITDKLYKGYASSVYKARCTLSNQVVVLKVYTPASVCDLYKYQIYREVALHSRLQHENVVTLHAAFQEADKVVLVEEYADGADLFNVMQQHGGAMTERLAVQLVLEPFIRVLHYLHTQKIMHRDIKPENILFSRDMVLKLGDFGLAIDIGQEKPVTRAGTLDYMAPEVLKCPYKSYPDENKDNSSLQYGETVDSWAVAVLAYELLVGTPPFYNTSRTETEAMILNTTPAMPKGMSEAAKDFITTCLQKNPARRLTIAQMLQHPWIEGYRNSRSVRVAEQQPLTVAAASSRAQFPPVASAAVRAAAAGAPMQAQMQAQSVAARASASTRVLQAPQMPHAAAPSQLLLPTQSIQGPDTPTTPPLQARASQHAKWLASPQGTPTGAAKVPAGSRLAPGASKHAAYNNALHGGKAAWLNYLLAGSSDINEYLEQHKAKLAHARSGSVAAVGAAPVVGAKTQAQRSQPSLAELSRIGRGDGSVIVTGSGDMGPMMEGVKQLQALQQAQAQQAQAQQAQAQKQQQEAQQSTVFC